jgi:uncharacterized protein (DUF2147 family)
MLRILIALAALAAPGLAAAQSAEGQSAQGLWRTATAKSGASLDVRIAPCGALLCGTIAAAHDTDRTDLVGRAILSGMKPDGPGKWSDGAIWAPDDDRTYRARMTLDGDALKVQGCVAVFCRGQTWTRIR